jgi:hypothetical protein
LYYLDREVLEANLGLLKELNETRRCEDEKRGIVKNITFEELEEIGVLGAGYCFSCITLETLLSICCSLLWGGHATKLGCNFQLICKKTSSSFTPSWQAPPYIHL